MNIITVKNVSKTFSEDGGKPIVTLKNINLEITEGEFFVLLGPSGSGKSTLLDIMSGLEPFDSGEVLLSDPALSHETAFVFQQFALLPWLTVFQNVELTLRHKTNDMHERHAMVRKMLASLGLEAFERHYPRDLSGGMKQRVGIARAFVGNPKIIFMDEPFSELDSFIANQLRKELLTMWASYKPTIIMVTHNITEAIELADRIAVLTDRPGKIEKVLTNMLPRPRNRGGETSFALEDELFRLIKP